MTTSHGIHLVARPEGKLTASDFAAQDTKLDNPQADQARVRTLYISIDAANRFWMHGDSAYHTGARAGSVMTGRTIGVVEACPSGALAEGTLVIGDWGWRDRANVKIAALQPTQPPEGGLPLSHLLSAFGISGLTGWFGVLEAGSVTPGDVVVVSAAAGAAGSFAAQIARIAGARVIGIAGGKEKCAWLRDELGIEPIDRHQGDVGKALDALLPEDGADMYFDNVGGATLEAMLPRTRIGGRIVCCGVVSQYDSSSAMDSPKGVPALIVTRRITMRGFIVLDYAPRFADARKRLASLIQTGALKVREDIMEGLESAPLALIDLLAGGNTGKRLVRVDPDAR